MIPRYCMALLLSVQGICHAQLTQESPVVKVGTPGSPSTAAVSVNQPLHPLFERYEGGSKESETKLIRSLAAKFALSQAAIGAATGGNKRGTHATGVCLEGELEIYDHPDNPWLQIGPFQKPLKGDQRPKVRIRFANGDPKPQPDRVPDVRAVSFSFTVDGICQDFSMNNAPLFSFGNLTDFNNYMAYSLFLSAVPESGKGATAARLLAANPDLAWSVDKALVLAKAQRGKEVYAFHTENYYSGSAFSFGKDRAARFSLVRCGGLAPVREPLPMNAENGTLVARTTSAVNRGDVADPTNDKRNEFCFELEVQILDVTKMKTPSLWTKAEPPTAADWVEDAALDWIEAGAPSYKLGKLTAVPNSIKTPEECERSPGFDVNKNCWDELKPLGRINRGRYLAERQSQSFRSQPVPEPAPASTTFTQSKVIEQGWNNEDRDTFWHMPQGSYIIPYDWFMALTDADTKKPLRDRDNLERFGFIHDSDKFVSARNPAQLPIGMTRESPPGRAFKYLRGKGDWLGINCAACHVGAVTANGARYIVDGGPSTLDLEMFSLSLERSLDALLTVDAEFKKFREILARQGVSVTLDDVKQVHQRLFERNTRSFFHNLDRKADRRVNSGPGRTDAFGVILNEVASRALRAPGNATVASAPASYPHLWGAPDEDWIQYSGLTNNAFTRNLGQVFGVFGDVILDPDSPDFLATTARFKNLQVLEDKLRDLRAPKWEKVFGAFSPTEQEQIKRGATVYERSCVGCHSHDPEKVTMIPATEFGMDLSRNRPFVGTDPLYFANLKRSWSSVDTGVLKGRSVLGVLGKNDADLAQMFSALIPAPQPYADKVEPLVVLTQTNMGIFLKYLKDKGIKMDLNDRRYRDLTGGKSPQSPTHPGAFKARSLNGIAFTGPYFHNGSVRTLRGVLNPEKRETSFYIGGTGYDRENGGFENAGSYLFQANKMGNLNIGHDFAADLSATDQDDLLMYLKSL